MSDFVDRTVWALAFGLLMYGPAFALLRTRTTVNHSIKPTDAQDPLLPGQETDMLSFGSERHPWPYPIQVCARILGVPTSKDNCLWKVWSSVAIIAISIVILYDLFHISACSADLEYTVSGLSSLNDVVMLNSTDLRQMFSTVEDQACGYKAYGTVGFLVHKASIVSDLLVHVMLVWLKRDGFHATVISDPHTAFILVAVGVAVGSSLLLAMRSEVWLVAMIMSGPLVLASSFAHAASALMMSLEVHWLIQRVDDHAGDKKKLADLWKLAKAIFDSWSLFLNAHVILGVLAIGSGSLVVMASVGHVSVYSSEGLATMMILVKLPLISVMLFIQILALVVYNTRLQDEASRTWVADEILVLQRLEWKLFGVTLSRNKVMSLAVANILVVVKTLAAHSN
eukprot:TRINITY_DN34247_c0_g1_i1.p1 TRINITY_DN34247_c0_g1~~TRINITY_DN34247_c0_g1_i1.p1  ORF type:complete len:446 (+),score=46.92 TRINITY_DN34247_c0_g1_i1:149-1339(+)